MHQGQGGSSCTLPCCTIVVFMGINVNVMTVTATQSTLIEQSNVGTCTRANGRAQSAASEPSWDHENCSGTEIITQAKGVFNFRREIKRSCCEHGEIINR